MKFRVRMSIAMFLLTPVLATAGDKEKQKATGQTVDSGTFGVFINGRRVATETFSIQQNNDGSTVSSQFKTDGETQRAEQTSELQLTPNIEIRKYEWKEISPGKAQATVSPNNEFLMERSSSGPNEKPLEQPFMLPSTTSILDDYFFIHREVLIWRYLATSCKQEKGSTMCPASQKTQFGTLNPHQRAPVSLTLEFSGRDKVSIRGNERELNKFVLRGDAGDWLIWVDDRFMLQRIVVSADNTEVVRD